MSDQMDRLQHIPDGSFVVIYSARPEEWMHNGEYCKKHKIDGIIVSPDSEVKIMNELQALRRVADAARGLKEHGVDLQNGTHANILWDALEALDAVRTTSAEPIAKGDQALEKK